MASNGDRGGGWWQRYGRVTILLLVFFATALFIRSYFNYDASYNDGDFVWSGTDGYYHMRVIDHLRETGEFLLHDPLINYPIGATNPRPPFFVWTIAALGGLLSPFFGGDAELATDAVAAFSPAVWGALTVFPVYFLGREAFGHKAGLWAAFLVAVMAAHITRSNLGALDHDATILFFFTLGAYFFAKALNLMRHRVYVEDYRRAGTIMPGWRDFFRNNQASVAYAALTGAAFAGIALTWKGFPYVYAVFAVWFGFQLLANHLRRVDSTPYFLLAVIPFIVTFVMIWPYYTAVGRIDSAVMPSVGILIGVLAASLVFVPTRHLPPVLVLPVTAGVIALALVVMLVVLPAVGQLYFTGLGYFVQNKLYSTIAEAQRTPLGYLVFATGVIPFFFALAGIVFGIVSFVKRRRDDHLFVLVWAAVGLLMAFTATRFVFNASVGFALLAGWMTARFVAFVRFGDVGKVWRSVRSAGYGVFKSARSAVGVRHSLAAIFLVFLLLLPQVWLGVDAGVPGEYINNQIDEDSSEREIEFWRNWFGAFGQDFLSDDWVESLAYLSERDTHLAPADRPAFMAWWDYGFYAAQRGAHPTVADPFQFGFEISGRVLASQSESEAILFMSLRLLEGNAIRGDTRGAFDPQIAAALDDVEPGLAADLYQPLRNKGYDEAYDRLRQALTEDGETTVPSDTAAAFYADVRDVTGKSIRYLTLDGRMFPCDDPRSQGVDSGSIFYAPVYLADKNPEDFVRTKYQDAQGQSYYQKVYQTTEDGGSTQVEKPYVVDNVGNRYLVSGGRLLPMGDNGFIDYSSPLARDGIQLATAGELEYSDAFYNSLLYRAWIGPSPSNPQDKVPPPREYAPGFDLAHFRVVYSTVPLGDASDQANRCNAYSRGVMILEYFDGAPVTGTVRDSSGAPMDDVTVQVTDNFGIVHSQTQTGEDGSFALSAPFSTDVADGSERAAQERPGRMSGVGPNTLRVVVNGGIVASENFTVTDEQAMSGGEAIPAFTITVELGTLEGVVFEDLNGDGAYNASTEQVLANTRVQLGDRNTTTDDQGRYAFANVRPGVRQLTAEHDDYTAQPVQADVPPGGSATQDIGMTAKPLEVSGVLTHEGTPVMGATVRFSEPITPDVEEPQTMQSPASNADGNYTMNVPRGTWEVSVDYQTIEDNQTVRYFTAEATTIELEVGDPPRELDLALSREVVA